MLVDAYMLVLDRSESIKKVFRYDTHTEAEPYRRQYQSEINQTTFKYQMQPNDTCIRKHRVVLMTMIIIIFKLIHFHACQL